MTVRKLGFFAGQYLGEVGNDVFRFTLLASSETSAAVYDNNDVNIRTLWNGLRLEAGTHVFQWDMKDDFGVDIAGDLGVDYTIKYVKSALTITHLGAPVGNTSTEDYGQYRLRSFGPMVHGVIDGNIFTHVDSYAERISSAHQLDLQYKGKKRNDLLDTTYAGEFQGESGLNCQWVCSDGTHLFIAGFDPYSNTHSMIFKVKLIDTSEASFSSGSSYATSQGRTYSSVADHTTSGTSDYPTGIAVNDNYLYVARGGIDTINIINKDTGAVVVANTDYTNPRNLSICGDKLVMTTGALGSASTKTYDLSGTTITEDATLSGLVYPLNIGVTKSEYKFYLQNVNSSISGYKTLQTWQPEATEAIDSVTTTSLGTEHLIQEFSTPFINLHQIPAATWTFNSWGHATAGTQALVYRVYKRSSGGTETQLFTVDSATLPSGAPPPLVVTTTTSAQGAFDLDETDIVIIKVYAKRSGGIIGSLVALYYDGTTHVSDFSIAPTTPYIYVIDGDSSQQIKQYELDGTAGFTHGLAGGHRDFVGNGPDVDNDKFYFDDDATGLYSPIQDRRPFIMAQLDETYWVFDNGNERLQHYDNDNTFIERIAWFPFNYIARIDRANPNRFFLQLNEYDLDVDDLSTCKTPIKNWRPGLDADHFEQLVDTFNFPTKFANNKTYVLLRRAADSDYELTELNDSTGLVYKGIYTPAFIRVWMAPNGDIYYLDIADYNSVGSTVILKKMPNNTTLSDADPVYGSTVTVATLPVIGANDGTGDSVLYNDQPPVITDDGKVLIYGIEVNNKNPRLCIFDIADLEYKAKVMPVTSNESGDDEFGYPLDYLGEYPKEFYFDRGNFVIYAGSGAYTATHATLGDLNMVTYKGEFHKLSQVNKKHLVLSNGMQITVFGVTGGEAIGKYDTINAPFEMAGNIYYFSPFWIDGDTAYVGDCDESFLSGGHIWKIEGLDTIVVSNALKGGTYIPSGKVDLFAGLPAHSNAVNTGGNFTKNPNTESASGGNQWWVYTDRHVYKPLDRSVWYKSQSDDGTDNYGEHAITPTATTEFTVECKVIFSGNTPHYDGVGAYIQILDSADKVIANFHCYRENTVEALHHAYGNETNILTFTRQKMIWYQEEAIPLSIRVHSGGCDFTYNGTTITDIAMIDPTADRLDPSKVRVLLKASHGVEIWTQPIGIILINLTCEQI